MELTPGADICFNPAMPGNADLEPNRQGGEVVVEQDDRPVVLLNPAAAKARTMPEIIAPVEAGGGGGDVAEDYAQC